MSTTILRLTGITIAAAGLVGLTATAASAHEASQLGGSYHLTISDRDGLHTAEATLTCYPHGGTHPDPYGACGQLEAAGGDVSALSEDPGPCTLEYNPVTVRSQGLWGNTYSVYEETFANKCAANRDTGGVLFDF